MFRRGEVYPDQAQAAAFPAQAQIPAAAPTLAVYAYLAGVAPITQSSTAGLGAGPLNPSSTQVVQRVEALHDFTETGPGELSFKQGDIINVVERRYKDWWRGQLEGKIGMFSANYVELLEPISTTAGAAPLGPSTVRVEVHVIASYDFDETGPGDLAFKRGDVIEVVGQPNDDWWEGQLKGKSGLFPMNHVKPLAPIFTTNGTVLLDPPTVGVVMCVKAWYDLDGVRPWDLSFKRGDIIKVVGRLEDDWWWGRLGDKIGRFPKNFVVEMRVKALHDFDEGGPGDLLFKKGDIVKVVDQPYDDWWEGQLGDKIGLFPSNRVDLLLESTAAELAKGALARGLPVIPVVSEAVRISHLMSASDIAAHLANHGCKNITGRLDLSLCSIYPISTGGFGDVYHGCLDDGTLVAIKTMRLQIEDDQKSLKHAARELHTWSKCRHPNVVELLGLAEFKGQLGMVSLWMENGNLPSYLDRHPDVDRCRMSMQISEGLAYLHRNNIIHGDLKGLNVLISNEGIPALTDFGNAVLNERTLQFTATTAKLHSSPRWAAPEIITGSGTHSFSADVYALGMTILETITGQVPYAEKADLAVFFAVAIKREHPKRPTEHILANGHYGNILWSMLVRCWAYEAEARPAVDDVVDVLQEAQTQVHAQAQPQAPPQEAQAQPAADLQHAYGQPPEAQQQPEQTYQPQQQQQPRRYQLVDPGVQPIEAAYSPQAQAQQNQLQQAQAQPQAHPQEAQAQNQPTAAVVAPPDAAPPYLWNGTANYPMPGACRWAEYYLDGGGDLSGLVYFTDSDGKVLTTTPLRGVDYAAAQARAQPAAAVAPPDAGPPFPWNGTANYPMPGACRWAEYYLDGGGDLSGLVYFTDSDGKVLMTIPPLGVDYGAQMHAMQQGFANVGLGEAQRARW